MSTHARLAPSAASRWMNCPGSVRLSDGLPDQDTEFTREGTAAHTLAEYELKERPWRGEFTNLTVEGHSIPITDEMRDAVGLFADTVRAEPGELLVERKINLGLLQPPEAMFGTADAIKIGTRKLTVFDLKYGQGVMVEVADNPQLLYYLLGALLLVFVRTWLDETMLDEGILATALSRFDTFETVIVQPRMSHLDGPVRRHTYTREQVHDFAIALLDRAKATQNPSATLKAGKWCRFCPAAGQCPELKAHAQLVAQVEFENVPVEAPPAPERLPIELCAEFLGKVHILEDWIRALRQRVFDELAAGRPVPGYKLVGKRPTRKWISEEQLVAWAKEHDIDVHTLYTLDVKSPAQVEKLVGKKNLPQQLVKSVSSGPTVAPESDARPAVAIDAQAEFDALPAATAGEHSSEE